MSTQPRIWGFVEVRRRKVGRLAPLSGRDAAILAASAEGKPLREIGEDMGITGERVRQIINCFDGVKPKAIREAAKKDRNFLRNFARSMKRHLWKYGFRRCATCKIWSCEVTKTKQRCRTCNAAHIKELYANNPAYREYLKAYNRSRTEYFRDYYRRKKAQREPTA